MKTLDHLFLDELAIMYDAECQFIKALPKLARAATCSHLKEAVRFHSEESQGHIKKLEQVFAGFHHKARGQSCETTTGLLLQWDKSAAMFAGSPANNAALIAVAQKVEHYEIAAYGCLYAWAEKLGNDEAAAILSEILDEEKAADVSLTRIALSRSNIEAMNESGAELFAGVGD